MIGVFYWALEAGEYKILGYHWQHLQTTKSGQIERRFVVAESGGDVYLGTFKFTGYEYFLIPVFEDRFDRIAGLCDAKFPARTGTSATGLLKPAQQVGSFANILGACDEAWKIECDKRFDGVTPISPKASQSGFPEVSSLTPEFSWKRGSRTDISCNLTVYEAATYSIGGALVPLSCLSTEARGGAKGSSSRRHR